jgi:hypothetical protein
MELSDRDRMLLSFANLASHGIAARPAMASDAAEVAAELRAPHPRGLRSYVFWHRNDDASFDPTLSVAIGVDMHLTAPLNVIRRWRMTVAGGQERRAAAFAASKREVAQNGS